MTSASSLPTYMLQKCVLVSKADTALHRRRRQARVVCTERPVRLKTRAAADPAALERAELAAAAAATANADAASAARYRSQRSAAHGAGASGAEASDSICASVYLASAAALPEVPALNPTSGGTKRGPVLVLSQIHVRFTHP